MKINLFEDLRFNPPPGHYSLPRGQARHVPIFAKAERFPESTAPPLPGPATYSNQSQWGRSQSLPKEQLPSGLSLNYQLHSVPSIPDFKRHVAYEVEQGGKIFVQLTAPKSDETLYLPSLKLVKPSPIAYSIREQKKLDRPQLEPSASLVESILSLDCPARRQPAGRLHLHHARKSNIFLPHNFSFERILSRQKQIKPCESPSPCSYFLTDPPNLRSTQFGLGPERFQPADSHSPGPGAYSLSLKLGTTGGVIGTSQGASPAPHVSSSSPGPGTYLIQGKPGKQVQRRLPQQRYSNAFLSGSKRYQEGQLFSTINQP